MNRKLWSKKIKRVAVLAKQTATTMDEVIDRLLSSKQAKLFDFCFEDTLKGVVSRDIRFCNISKLCADADVLLILGGDGTLLSGARWAVQAGIPVVGVNLGTLGFLTEIQLDELDDVLQSMADGKLLVQPRLMLEADVNGERHIGLNDVTIHKGSLARITLLHTYIDGRHMTDYRADGIIIASPTGSTAYSLSAGGPISEPGLDGIIVTPICAHSFSNRPVVLHDFEEILIRVGDKNDSVFATIDGQIGIDLETDAEITIRRHKHPLQLAVSPKRDFFDVLRIKLNWGQKAC